MMNYKLLTIGKKFDVVNDYFENLLWFINHCNMPMTDEYLYKCGLLVNETEKNTYKYTICCSYKDVVVLFKDFTMYAIESKKEMALEEAKKSSYYQLMNQFLLWTGAADYKKMIEKLREEINYAPLSYTQEYCARLISDELSKTRIENKPFTREIDI